MILPLVVLLEGALGKNLRAVAANESAARAFGINVNRHLIPAFVWSSAVIACAGAIMAPRYRIIDPDSYGILASILALAYPIVGGMGSPWGGLVGGAVLRALPEVLRPLADYLELMFCILVVTTIIFFPGGFGSFVTRTFRRKPTKLKTSARSEPRRAVHDFISDMNILGRREVRPPQDRSRSTPILRISGVTKSYGALRAVSHVSFDVTAQTIHGLMGPNGAGKTTLFNIVSGLNASDEGQVLFDGTPLDDVPVESRIKLGMSRTFQHAAVFDKLSCVDNVLIGLGLNDIWHAAYAALASAMPSRAPMKTQGRNGRSRRSRSRPPCARRRRLIVARRSTAPGDRTGDRLMPTNYPARRAGLRRVRRGSGRAASNSCSESTAARHRNGRDRAQHQLPGVLVQSNFGHERRPYHRGGRPRCCRQ